MTSHASRKTKHFPPRLRNSFLILTPSHGCSVSARPFPSPGPENSSTNKMRATREKSHSQLGGPTAGWLFKGPEALGSQVSPSHPAKPSWKEDLLCARASPECREGISLNVPSRGNCIPQGVAGPQMCLLDSNTNTAKSRPAVLLPRKQRPPHVTKPGAASEHGGFL